MATVQEGPSTLPEDIQARLARDAASFDALLSLIPANLYFAKDNSDQWKAKKQTPEQRRAARIAKLNPDNHKSAKEVLFERSTEGIAAAEAAKKRKRKEGEMEREKNKDFRNDDDSLVNLDLSGEPEVQPPKSKKQKMSSTTKVIGGEGAESKESVEDRRRRKAEKRAAKRARKNESKAKQKEKMKELKAKKKSEQVKGNTAGANDRNAKQASTLEVSSRLSQHEEVDEEEDSDQSSTTSSEDEQSEVFSPPHESGTSSTSSILQPSALEDTLQPSNKPNDTDTDPLTDAPAATTTTTTITTSTPATHQSSQTPRERLQAAIQQRRAERRADGPDGRAPKNRQELLEQRRRKEEQRKAAKKEQKRREKEEEARRQDEEIARRFSPGGSGSLLASPRSPLSSAGGGGDNLNFSFGRIAFSDGTQFDPTAADVVGEHKRKGPRDTAAQLKIALAKKTKLSGLDEEKRRDIEQKDMWLKAKKRAHGEHVRDDTSLLKKALKRQQGQKKKSEREWTDRIQGVQKAQEARQKKRTENLARRKEEKRSSSSRTGGGGGGVGKKVKRPGFEGSFKGRTGGRKK
ncbi:hypothetical protein PV08_10850 [Exophiala spinifera]|uniref:Ribosomal RNA-processing protein 14/surfeit locus protein 6 C-terminal domain-containing protein n=1 Tax=Exophiala spinifera TaxID=91928 RepID=A0A0D2BJV4_9EURO|nr:uncharacterized protein PV08_10850 [Exophiala spinifera]KIW11549.1 hypothetical protein PV08_10850 [Exophiala spinifera]